MVVKVSKALCQELTKIKDSGAVDMQNSRAVLEYAEKHGLMLAARAVRTIFPERKRPGCRTGEFQTNPR